MQAKREVSGRRIRYQVYMIPKCQICISRNGNCLVSLIIVLKFDKKANSREICISRNGNYLILLSIALEIDKIAPKLDKACIIILYVLRGFE